jgi:hypothetical protein
MVELTASRRPVSRVRSGPGALGLLNRRWELRIFTIRQKNAP